MATPTITVKDSGTHSGSQAPITWTASYTPTPGNVILFMIACRDGGDTTAAGWTKIAYALGGGLFTDSIMAFIKEATGSETNWDPDDDPGGSGDWIVCEIANVDIATAIGGVGLSHQPGPTLTSPSVEPSGASDAIVIGAWAQTQDAAKVFSPGSGYSEFWNAGGASHPIDYAVYQVGPAGIAYTPNALSDKTNNWWGLSFSIGGVSLPGMWVDWDRDGFGNSIATGVTDHRLARGLPEGPNQVPAEDEITSDVIHSTIKIDRPGNTSHVGGGSQTSGMTFRVRNEDGKYNPDNTASPLYGKLSPGLPVWYGVNIDGSVSDSGQTVYGRFGGYVKEIVPLPEERQAEIICEDALARFRGKRARVEFAADRTIAEYREAVLSSIGETRLSLCDEPDVLAFSGTQGTKPKVRRRPISGTTFREAVAIVDFTAPSDALGILEDLNNLFGTRHFIAPADSKEGWYRYVTVPRTYKLTADADAAFDGDDITSTTGYRVTWDGLVNLQEVEVRPTSVSLTDRIVWTADDVPFTVDPATPRTITADFGDYVFDATLDVASTGASVTSVFTPFGDGALIQLYSSGNSTITGLSVSGRPVIRGDSRITEKSDSSSTNRYGEFKGSLVSSDYMQSPGWANGLAEFVIWKFAQPLKRQQSTLANVYSTVLPLELYDVVTQTIDRLNVSARRFEITGIHEEWNHASTDAKYATFTFDLQETPNQTALTLFTIGVSLLGGSDGLAP